MVDQSSQSSEKYYSGPELTDQSSQESLTAENRIQTRSKTPKKQIERF